MRYFFEVWEASPLKITWLLWVMSTKSPGVGFEDEAARADGAAGEGVCA